MENTISGLWKSNLPKKGWVYIDVIDTGEQATNCTWCGTLIRYVHALKHPDTGISTECGCICAEHLMEDYVGPKQKEKALKGKQARIRNWVKSPKWKSHSPHLFERPTKDINLRIRVTFSTQKNGWQVVVVKRELSKDIKNFFDWKRIEGKVFHKSLPEAKAASLSAYEYIKSKEETST